MLEFPCTCGHAFSLPDDQASTQVQCPECRRLVDVPTSAELGAIHHDGTYAIRPREGDRQGGATPTAPEAAHPVPRYDPDTGQLIRAHTLNPHRPPADLASRALAAPAPTPALRYATAATPGAQGAHDPAVELLLPANLFVIGILFFAQLAILSLDFLVLRGIFLFALPMLALWGLVAGHWANVIDEIGPAGNDALPRPLRDVELHADIFSPLVHFLTAAGICYGVAALALALPGPAALGWALAAVLALPGTVLFPAVLLTTATSGSVLNLRPDSLRRVIRAWGARTYATDVALWAAAAACYALGVPSAQEAYIPLVGNALATAMPGLTRPLGFLLLALSVYTMHLVCWRLGLTYRMHHEQFEWALQKHVSEQLLPASPLADAPGANRPKTGEPPRAP